MKIIQLKNIVSDFWARNISWKIFRVHEKNAANVSVVFNHHAFFAFKKSLTIQSTIIYIYIYI